ncbi:putative phage abortive infection protein [Gillisia sp. Hel_I_29]|uniref:putative phage abortive infection protein n=1 Tax=Gillisia sp. Hel_I_29 TaxID=1249975 RepID=UPI0005558E54|nr:putative phage abortive infection protein [Gillisia sp. Hel_I_29]
MRQFLRIFSALTILSGIIVAIFFFNKLTADFQVLGENAVLLKETAYVGNFIGGVVGTFFSLGGFFILILTLSEQTKFAHKERFESKFFDLVKLHRENVRELEKDNTSGRKEFHKIFLQFLECREDMKPVFRRANENTIYEKKYADELREKFNLTNENINLVDLAKLNLPYLVTFYGVGSHGREAIYDFLENKYKKAFIKKAIEYISMKPAKSSLYFQSWSRLNKLPSKSRVRIAQLIRRIRNNEIIPNDEQVDLANEHFYKSDYVKFYGGHQYQLGHYFRHLFQTFSFINIQNNLRHDEKYFYAKTLRAQLSTHEQLLLFINSISSLGMVWDLTPEISKKWYRSDKDLINEKRLITKYNLIKNIPGKKIFGITYSYYYPNVEFEQ